MNNELPSLAFQQSNDIESHYEDPVNTPEDLTNSLIAWEYLTDQDRITPEIIETIHWLITKNSLPKGDRGVLRSRNGYEVSVGGRNGLTWRAVQNAIEEWIAYMPARTPKDSHIAYEKIHPFVDGNGRSGRMLYYWQLNKIGELNADTIIYDKDRNEYYQWF